MSQPESFSDHKAKYAAWRERMRGSVQSNKLIDLTKPVEPEAEPDDWSTDGLFVSSDDAEEDQLLPPTTHPVHRLNGLPA